MAYQTINPATGKLIKTYATYPTRILRPQWRARIRLSIAIGGIARNRAWKIMSTAAAILRKKSDEYSQYLTLEVGKLIAEARAEVALSADILNYYAQKAENYLEPRVLSESPGAELHIEPIGVLLGIEPWNFPYYQIARVAGPQLMRQRRFPKHAENVPSRIGFC
jgi:succinate-semialdehyde dehydrogenase/glutarate-semialdehyde dehydrogenase